MGLGKIENSNGCTVAQPVGNRTHHRVFRFEWPTIVLLICCYSLWAGAGIVLWPGYPLVAIAVLSVAVALHSSLCHEVAHGHPTPNAYLNEALVFLPLGLVYPFRRFRSLHLRHHADERLTDPFDDPESCYQAFWKHQQLPKLLQHLLRLNNTMVGRFVLGPPMMTIGLILTDGRSILEGDTRVRKAWLLHAIGMMPVVFLVSFAFGMPFWLYALTAVWIGHSFISIRTFAEHQWAERPDGRTIIVERSPLGLLFLNNNLHLVHHKNPTVAWYRLPELYRSRRQEWHKMNDGYVYPNYLALLKKHAFRGKEPVVHPVLRRAPEPGRAFQPRQHRVGQVVHDSTIPVPAEPSKK